MNSPIAALTWEIWRRGRIYAWLCIGCVLFCALINLVVLDRLHIPPMFRKVFPTIFSLLMTLSFLFLAGIFNYTETNSTKEWSGFPYRLFVLPVRTWQLVALPMVYGVAAVELLYLAWVKLVWTHTPISMPEWFAVVFGAYMVFYQTALWTLAGFRLVRMVALALGAISGVVTASLPSLAQAIPLPWLTEDHLIFCMLFLAAIAFLIGWGVVSRQRSGGGKRRTWVKVFIDWIIDVLPKRAKDFASPAAAQFWFEWRRTGWLLPISTAIVLIAVIAPASWSSRHDPQNTINALAWLLATPLILAFVIGKGFIKCEFWATSLSMTPFMAVRPLAADEFVINKLKVAALSVALAWLPVLVFVSLWLPFWADKTTLNLFFLEFQILYPHSWMVILALSFFGLLVLTWRFMASGLWAGLSGRRLYYFGSSAVQVLIPILALVAIGIWSDKIDWECKNHGDLVLAAVIRIISWSLAVLVIARAWFAAFSWDKTTPRRTRQYTLIWLGATICFITLAVLARPLLDTYRQEHIYLLAALCLFPFARLGIAPRSLAKNRHGL